ncbi:MAG: DUF6261 family protein [Verrucomicrobiales bacterium]|jgi:hypothetical protein|nr:DUF6261 family protein [Verrucomicrobiales bacterium]
MSLLKLAPHSFVKNLRLEEFFTFCSQVEKFIEAAGGNTALGVNASLNTAFRKALAAYDTALEHIRASAVTPELRAVDKRRDENYTAWREQVRSVFKFTGSSSWHDKAAACQAVVDNYYRAHRSPDYNEETGIIRNLYFDFSQAPVSNYVTELKLNRDILEKLHADNEEFDRLYLERTAALAAGQHDLGALRATLSATLNDLLTVVAALAVSAEYRGKYDTLTRDINELIAQYRVLLDRRYAANKRRDEAETQA